MWLDILCFSLMVYAFITGFQKGIMKTFSIWLSAGLAFLLTLIAAPYIFAFLESSFVAYTSEIDLLTLISTFTILLFITYKVCKKVFQNDQVKNKFGNQLSGGVLFSVLMIGSIIVMITFFETANVINQKTAENSITFQLVKPLQEKSSDFFKDIKVGASAVKNRKQGPTNP